MRVNSLNLWNMASENKHSQMEIFMRVVMSKVYLKEKENILGLMELFSKENLSKDLEMGKG